MFSVISSECETNGKPDDPQQFDERAAEVLKAAQFFFEQTPAWTSFYRDVLGVGGLVARAFPDPDESAAFEQSFVWGEIQAMLGALRKPRHQPLGDFEPSRVITVRLPKCLHESLKAEAHEKRTSVNQLCLSKLMQAIDGGLVPGDF